MGSIDSVSFDVSLSGDFPALLPPPGEKSNFKDPYSRGQDVVIASSICLALMLSMVLLRFYTKLCIKHIWGWDDCKRGAPGKHQAFTDKGRSLCTGNGTY